MNEPAPAAPIDARRPEPGLIRRVAILCATAQPGSDGVGDYAARVASELERRGIGVCLIALRDRYVAGPEPRREPVAGIDTLRLPGSASDGQRAEWLSAALEALRPDCLYLQVVCWGLAPRGILLPMPIQLAGVLKQYPVVLNAHELWLGLERGASIKHRVWGNLQRSTLLRFFTSFRPVRVVTSTPDYAAVLARHGWPSVLLPIASNIAVTAEDAQQVWPQIAACLPEGAGSRSDHLVAVTFATIVPQWKPSAALAWLAREAKMRGQRFVFVAVGRTHAAGRERLAELQRALGSEGSVVTLGERPAPFISELLRDADIGMPSTPANFLGKSGAAAAMRIHGLPLLLVDRGIRLRGIDVERSLPWPGCEIFDADQPTPLFALLGAKHPPRDDIGDIADRLLEIMTGARNAP